MAAADIKAEFTRSVARSIPDVLPYSSGTALVDCLDLVSNDSYRFGSGILNPSRSSPIVGSHARKDVLSNEPGERPTLPAFANGLLADEVRESGAMMATHDHRLGDGLSLTTDLSPRLIEVLPSPLDTNRLSRETGKDSLLNAEILQQPDCGSILSGTLSCQLISGVPTTVSTTLSDVG